MVRHKDVLIDKIGRLVDDTIDIEQQEEADWSEPKSIIRQLLGNKNLDRSASQNLRIQQVEIKVNRKKYKNFTQF
jgi:hypothetical protein